MIRKTWIGLALAAILICTPANVAAAEPSVEALGAILMDYDTGRVLWEKDARKPLAMASTTKIMTCIVALENGDLSDMVTITNRAAAAPNVQMHLQAGEEISLQDLLYAMMLQSSNDAAIAVAEHIGGTVEDFCAMMTEKARLVGAEDTVFETPNGLDGDNHHSTAYDLAMIARYALHNAQFRDIIAIPHHTAQSSRTTYAIINKNRLLTEFHGADGIKTGFTGKAGHCFVGSAARDGLALISVVLGSGWGEHGKQQKWVDTKRLLEYGFASYAHTEILAENAPAGKLFIERAKQDAVDIYYAEGVRAPMTEAERETVVVKLHVPEMRLAPVERGETVGTAEIYIEGALYRAVDIRAGADVVRHDLKTSLEKVCKAFLGLATNEEIELVLPEF